MFVGGHRGQIANSQGYSDNEAGYLGACVIGFGLLGAGIAGVYVDIKKQFIAMLRVNMLGATAGALAFVFFLQPGAFLKLAIPLGVIGLFGFGMLPTGLELAVEATYPVSPGTSAGFLWMTGQILGVIFILVSDAIKGTGRCFPDLPPANFTNYTCPYVVNGTVVFDAYDDMTNPCWLVAAFASAALLLTFFIRTPYKRLEFERQQIGKDIIVTIENNPVNHLA